MGLVERLGRGRFRIELSDEFEAHLTLRSECSERLEGWQRAPCLLPCFETLAALAPQHEVEGLRFSAQRKRLDQWPR
jgi:hypothetical protein